MTSAHFDSAQWPICRALRLFEGRFSRGKDGHFGSAQCPMSGAERSRSLHYQSAIFYPNTHAKSYSYISPTRVVFQASDRLKLVFSFGSLFILLRQAMRLHK